jgi:chromosome segregation ATPase
LSPTTSSNIVRIEAGVCSALLSRYVNLDIPMGTRLTLVTVRRSAFFLLTSLLLVGCNGVDPGSSSATQKNASQGRAEKVASAGSALADRAGPTPSPAEQNRQAEQRVAQLEQELTGARAQRTRLLQRQAEINARIAAHQEEGMQLLASLKAQHGAPSGTGDAFETTARSKLETALAQDTELTDELQSADKELSDVEARLATLTAEINAVRNAHTAKSDARLR